MAEAACKAANCLGGCLYSIITDNVRETAEVVVKLATTANLDEDQLADVIDIGTEFQQEVKRRQREDRELLKKLETAIPDLVIG